MRTGGDIVLLCEGSALISLFTIMMTDYDPTYLDNCILSVHYFMILFRGLVRICFSMDVYLGIKQCEVIQLPQLQR